MMHFATALVFVSGAAFAASGTFAALTWQTRMDQALPGFIDGPQAFKAHGTALQPSKYALLSSAIDRESVVQSVVTSTSWQGLAVELAQASTGEINAAPRPSGNGLSPSAVIDTRSLAVATPDEVTLDVLRVEKDRRLSVAGTGKFGSTIFLVDGNKVIGQTTVSERGSFSLRSDRSLEAGNKSIVVVSRFLDGSQKRSSETGIVRLPSQNEPGNIMTLIVGDGTPTRITQDTDQNFEIDSATGDELARRDVAPDVTVSQQPSDASDADAETAPETKDETTVEEKPADGDQPAKTDDVADAPDQPVSETLVDETTARDAPPDEPKQSEQVRLNDKEPEVAVIPSKRPAQIAPSEKRTNPAVKKKKQRKTRSVSKPPKTAAPRKKEQPPSVASRRESVGTEEGPVIFRPPQKILIPITPDEVSEGPDGSTRKSSMLDDQNVGKGGSINIPQALRDGADIDELVDVFYGRISGDNRSLISALVLIRKGDNLWNLSRATLGQGYRYPMLYKANRDQIHNPHLIYPGQLLRIPNRIPAS